MHPKVSGECERNFGRSTLKPFWAVFGDCRKADTEPPLLHGAVRRLTRDCFLSLISLWSYDPMLHLVQEEGGRTPLPTSRLLRLRRFQAAENGAGPTKEEGGDEEIKEGRTGDTNYQGGGEKQEDGSKDWWCYYKGE